MFLADPGVALYENLTFQYFEDVTCTFGAVELCKAVLLMKSLTLKPLHKLFLLKSDSTKKGGLEHGSLNFVALGTRKMNFDISLMKCQKVYVLG